MTDISADHDEYIAKLSNMTAGSEKFVTDQRAVIVDPGKLRREPVGVVLRRLAR
jgi:hypothetical protein